MRSLIITVAGTATRFNQDTEEQTLKCLYYIDSPKNSLLYQIFDKSRDVDEIIVVGGFLYEKLCAFIKEYCEEFSQKIRTVFNPLYADYGSGYSLIEGIKAVSETSDQVIFVEGDLFFDANDFLRVRTSVRDVITVNRELIDARKSVILYKDTAGHIKYVYDTGHQALFIREPFTAIFNSGQIWKFTDPARLRAVIDGLSAEQEKGTNLEIIQGYFGGLSSSDIEIVPLSIWYNCNTVADYKKVYETIERR